MCGRPGGQDLRPRCSIVPRHAASQTREPRSGLPTRAQAWKGRGSRQRAGEEAAGSRPGGQGLVQLDPDSELNFLGGKLLFLQVHAESRENRPWTRRALKTQEGFLIFLLDIRHGNNFWRSKSKF